ncbi:HNH endonuclease signature motif containing protein [Nocardiopsis sp. RSe5-2]|uniref:HNH endonuclease signature motif containing protein n=1 Tax=Nocardiopsis endophytica TaxID=3018445 RepID=A0ABT4TZS3_9ACTN|nr:HNH endonuclease signature motif containing protein [Nocardiopsis endophytica]MDA2810190.1 HNH endonuclease signature motif containing protein [Nocardiopsis endophytica]
MASQQHPSGPPPGSRAQRIQAGLTGVLDQAHGALAEDFPAGAQHLLCDLLAVLAAGLGALDLALARLAARINQTGALAGTGHATVAGLLREHGRSSSQATAIMTVADHLDDYPQAVRAAEEGRIAFAQLAQIMGMVDKAVGGRDAERHPDAADYRGRAEHIMVTAAESGVADGGLKRLGRELQRRLCPQEHEERHREAYADRGAETTANAFGFNFHAWGDAASEEILRAALDHHTAPPGDGRTIKQRRYDALIQICENSLHAEGLPVPTPAEGSDVAAALAAPRPDQASGKRRRGMSRPQVNLVVSLDALLLKEGAEPATTDRGRLLPPSAARAFASDCVLRRVVTDPVKGLVDIGRARRTFPAPLLQALGATAGTCQWEEGCSVPARWCQGDHRTEWWEGGTTTPSNAQLLCGRHNREKHMRRLEAHYRARRHNTRTGKHEAGGDDEDGALGRAA